MAFSTVSVSFVRADFQNYIAIRLVQCLNVAVLYIVLDGSTEYQH